jgi:hypothetical protein
VKKEGSREEDWWRSGRGVGGLNSDRRDETMRRLEAEGEKESKGLQAQRWEADADASRQAGRQDRFARAPKW